MTQLITPLELVAFFASLLALPVLRREAYLLIFPILLFIVCLVEVNQAYFKFEDNHLNNIIYNIHLLLESILYFLILYLSYHSKLYKKLTVYFIATFIVVLIITSIYFYQPQGQFNVAALCTASIFLVIGILLKFYEILKSPTNYNFLKNPFFFMLFAFLLFNVGTLPYYTMANWLSFTLDQKELVKELVNMLVNVMSILNIVLYSTYTICFVWMRVMKPSF